MSTLLEEASAAPHSARNPLSARARLLGTENAFKIGPYIREVEEGGERVIRCNLGEPDFPLTPHIRDEVKRQLDLDLTHYCDPQGLLPLREAIAEEMGARRGLSISPDRVVVFPGAKTPIGFCQEVYCDPGDEVIYPSPGFPIYESFTAYVGARPVPYRLDEETGFDLSPGGIERLITDRTKLLVVSSPSNPTGGVVPRETLEELADVVQRRCRPDVRVFSDEVYESIVFDGAAHASIASVPGMERRTVIVSGASKTFSWTGGRIGWAVFPTPDEAQVFKNMNINYFSCVPPYNQMGACLGLRSPASVPWIASMVAAFQERRDHVVEGLDRIPGLRCQKPRGAFYVFPNVAGACESLGAIAAWEALPSDLQGRTTPSTLLQMFLLYRYRLATMDRKSFGRIGSEGQHFLRLSIATARSELQEAVRRIAVAVDDRAGFAEWMSGGGRLY